MATGSDKQTFVPSRWADAVAAGNKFGMNPVAILAQAAIESDWGTSYSAENRNNFFGMTVGSAKSNEFWDGAKSQSSASGLWFRIYGTPKNSFLDFASLISRKYPDSCAKSQDIPAYAQSIAYSRYISTDNGDVPENYRLGIITAAEYIQSQNLPKIALTNGTMGKVIALFSSVFMLVALYQLGIYYYPQYSFSSLWNKLKRP